MLMFKVVQQTLETQRQDIRKLQTRLNELVLGDQSPNPFNQSVASVDSTPTPDWVAYFQAGSDTPEELEMEGQELGCPLVVMLECGMATPMEEPEPDEYHLDTLIAKYALYPELQAILHKHADAFAKHKYDCGCMSVTIVVDGGDVPAQKQYAYPEQAIPYIAKVIKSLLAQEVLRRCTSTANSPIWPVKKPDGSWCLTINYRWLNQVTPTCAPTVAKMPDLIKSFDLEAKWFSVLDISNSFWTLPVAQESQYRFASKGSNIPGPDYLRDIKIAQHCSMLKCGES
ncbi:uncharacterized protein LOC135972748 [Chrysemys picta bellii]|uniref:uncharacterized protein LOC135972748 n=1 Tax=Chrysemys picta bellii TaxID=8478 RepID=UPI0032B2D574